MPAWFAITMCVVSFGGHTLTTDSVRAVSTRGSGHDRQPHTPWVEVLMSNELIVAVVPSETFIYTKPMVWSADEGVHAPVTVESLLSKEEWWRIRRDRAAILDRFPRAFYVLHLPLGSVWHQPVEDRLHGPDTGRPSEGVKRRRREHQAAVRASLEEFVNAKLKGLDQMVRTGWWILAEARVRVSRFRGMP